MLARRLKNAALRWLPLLLWMAAIFLLSSRTPTQLPDFDGLDLLVKKVSHFLAYALLALLALWAVQGRKRPFLWALLITVLYALSDEWHQTFVPGRNGNLLDVLIDSLGGVTALLLVQRLAFRPHLQRLRRSSRPLP